MRKVLIVFLLAFSFSAQSQTNGTVRIAVTDAQQQPVENATAELLRSKDSQLVRTALSDKSGLALFDNTLPGNYFIRITFTGYAPYTSATFEYNGQPVEIPAAHLSPATTALSAVTITGKKPFIQRLQDRIVVNVENSIVGAGSTAMDVLERSPGIAVDQNDVIALRGRQGVIIMIDGKPTPLAGSDLANYLRGLPASAIERIDIITNPSARYDAAGKSGIIDIRMKKDQRMGSNGTLTAGFGQGVYSRYNAGGTFNYRNKKINIFGNYNYLQRTVLNHLMLQRNFYEQGQFTGSDSKDNYARMPFNTHTVRAGADFFPSDKTTIGFVVNGNFNHFTRDNGNSSLVMDNNKQLAYTFQTQANNNDHNNNAVANINFRHSFDSSGRELTMDADYGVYSTASLSSTNTRYFRPDGTSLQPDYLLDGDQDGKLKLRTAKADLVYPLHAGNRLEAGLKTSYVSADNDAQFFDRSSGTPVEDPNKTNHFLYGEYNHAAYLNYKKDAKRFDLQLGLRAEYTDVSTNQLRGAIKRDTNYLQLFPSAFFNYKIKDDQTIGVSVSRRINRPGYSDLNPFLFLIDISTYATGNPSLLPELTWSYEMNYTWKELNFTLGYSHTKHNESVVIARFRDVFPNIPSNDNVTVQIPVNLTSSDHYGISIAAPVHPAKWWDMVNNADIFYEHFNGNLGGSVLDNGSPAAEIRTDNSFVMGKGWRAEFNGRYSTGGRYSYMVTRPQWAVAVGAQKSILQNKGTLRLNVTDIFRTDLPGGVITYTGSYIEHWHANRDTRLVNLTFTYRLGNSKVAAARRHATASEEERRRAGGN